MIAFLGREIKQLLGGSGWHFSDTTKSINIDLSHRPAKSELANNNDSHTSETTTLVSHRFRETVYALCGEKNLSLGYFYFDYEREVTEKNGRQYSYRGSPLYFLTAQKERGGKEKTALIT